MSKMKMSQIHEFIYFALNWKMTKKNAFVINNFYLASRIVQSILFLSHKYFGSLLWQISNAEIKWEYSGICSGS